MTPERWERVQDLYHASRARPDRERAQFLADVCAGDDALRREVQALLDQPVATSSFVDFIGGPAPRPRASDPSPLTGQRLGSYQVSSLIGRGGMGEVYRAHDVKLGRDVAIDDREQEVTIGAPGFESVAAPDRHAVELGERPARGLLGRCAFQPL